MIQNDHIHQGYKFSPLGIIPQEWEVKQICDVGKVITGSTPPTNDESCFGSEYMFVTPADIVGTKYIVDTERKLSTKGFSASRKMPKGCILFTCIGSTIGKMAIAATELTSNQQINAIICNDIDNDFLFYGLSYQQNRIRLLAGEQAVPIINKSDFKRIKIAVPPIEEQKKIAELLSEWDKAIELQTKLIEKLELRKRALMQRLFTGRIRLNGFSDKWKKKRLSEIGVFLSSNTLSREKLNKIGGHIQNIHYGDILIHYPTIVNPEYSQIPYVNRDVIVTSDLLQDGDIIFADTAEDNTVGKAIEIVNVKSRQIVAGLHTIPFRPNKGLFAKQFLGYYINSESYQKQLRALTQGIKVCSISKSSIKNTYLQIPSLAEQTAIAEVLISADKEIEIAKTKLSSLRNQKRGLMQQLLTGKKRINYGKRID